MLAMKMQVLIGNGQAKTNEGVNTCPRNKVEHKVNEGQVIKEIMERMNIVVMKLATKVQVLMMIRIMEMQIKWGC